MDCLLPYERNKLLKDYIDRGKINMTHIYLAQLMQHDYVDYVLTVNFDNLMLRALALFDTFPATYDMAILKDQTTTKPQEKSVIYLHGQHHGLWLLNTAEEMAKVEKVIPPLLQKDERPWVFIGYSGEDPIFQHIKKLGRFDNGLYWVDYNDSPPSTKVCDELLDKDNTTAFLIKGYDADAFMLKLSAELKIPHLKIIDTPFSTLGSLLNNIVDIDDETHFKGVKERLAMAQNNVKKAVEQFEQGTNEPSSHPDIKRAISQLKKDIINAIIEEKYDPVQIQGFEERTTELNNPEIDQLLANIYFNWGNTLYDRAQTTSGDEASALFQQAAEKYQKTVEIKPDIHEAFNNWGLTLSYWAKTTSGDEAENLFQQAIEKQEKAISLGSGFYNLSCIYAMMSNKANALDYLKRNLDNQEITPTFVTQDEDWSTFLDDDDFKSLIRHASE